MGKVRRLALSVTTASLLACGLIVTPSSAAPAPPMGAPAASVSSKASVNIKGSRVVVKFTGKQPSKAVLVAGGGRYTLRKSGKAWRTKILPKGTLTALSGAKAKVKAKVGGKNRTFTTTVGTASDAPPETPTPIAPAPPADPPTPAPLFEAPGVDRTGNPAWDAVKVYFLDSRFTNCVQGWGPTCFSEERYGHFADYTQVYCRLTSAPGADITNYRKPMTILGAEQKANGAWGVSYDFDYGDGQSRIYTWFVQPDGSASGRYWYNADPNLSPPTEEISGLVWTRGAKDCTY